jgi:proteasome lid subunit RPN8/RPN11
MDSDIQFGEVEETPPLTQLRPDRNKHFAAVVCGTLRDDDLPIFIDLDVMRDMEAHALSNTNVELGGVMLGGQYQDQQGNPFVVVTDSLRATHYESTKGSFKFTHDTWSEITRQRDEFPAELSMVGWYHTHPDWGVFLSGMDMFICDHFFNKPLDVALVIDPCRDDRGMFQWTGDPGDRIRRTGGFYLISSRFRHDELALYAAQMEGTSEMASDPRSRGFAPPHIPAPVVNIADSQSPWQSLAVFGMLTTQFVLLALIAWRLLLPITGGPPSAPPANQLQAERQILDRIVGDLEVAPEGLVTELSEQHRQNDELRAANRGLHAQLTVLDQRNEEAQQRIGKLVERQGVLEKDLGTLREDNRLQRARIASLEKQLDKSGAPGEDDINWTFYIVGGLLIVAAGAGIAVAMGMRKPEDQESGEPASAEPDFSPDSAGEESPPDTREEDRGPTAE